MSKITVETIKTIDGVASGVQREKALELVSDVVAYEQDLQNVMSQMSDVLAKLSTGVVARSIGASTAFKEELAYLYKEKQRIQEQIDAAYEVLTQYIEDLSCQSKITPEIEQAIAACEYPGNPSVYANNIKHHERVNTELKEELRELEAYSESEDFGRMPGLAAALITNRIEQLRKLIAEGVEEIEKYFLWILEYLTPAEDADGEYERIGFDYIGEKDKDRYSRNYLYCKRGQSAETIEKSTYMSLGTWKVVGVTPVTVERFEPVTTK